MSSERKVVVYLGGMERSKGIDYLLKAIGPVVMDFEDVHFLIMGYPGQERVRDMVRWMGVQRHVTITGKVPYLQAHNYLSLGGIAVAPIPLA